MTNTEDYDDISWLDETIFDSKGPLSTEAKRTLEAETMKLKRDAALDEGRHEAFSEIMSRGQAITTLICNGDQAAHDTWKAEGALRIWRVAYEAIYREMLVIKDQEQAMDCGAGLPDGLPGITPEKWRTLFATPGCNRKWGGADACRCPSELSVSIFEDRRRLLQ